MDTDVFAAVHRRPRRAPTGTAPSVWRSLRHRRGALRRWPRWRFARNPRSSQLTISSRGVGRVSESLVEARGHGQSLREVVSGPGRPVSASWVELLVECGGEPAHPTAAQGLELDDLAGRQGERQAGDHAVARGCHGTILASGTRPTIDRGRLNQNVVAKITSRESVNAQHDVGPAVVKPGRVGVLTPRVVGLHAAPGRAQREKSTRGSPSSRPRKLAGASASRPLVGSQPRQPAVHRPGSGVRCARGSCRYPVRRRNTIVISARSEPVRSELVQRGGDQARAGRADRMTQGDRAAVRVHALPCRASTPVPTRAPPTRRLRLISDHVDVVHREAGAIEQAAGRIDRPGEHEHGIDADEAMVDDPPPAPSSRAPERGAAVVTSTAAAPSVIWDDEPAVCTPFSRATGLSFASASSDVSRRPSSRAT